MRDLCSQGSKHKVVCVQNLMSDPRLPYKQYTFCEKQKELTIESIAKVILYPFQGCFQKVQKLLTEISNFSHVSQRNVTAAIPPPPFKRTIDVSCG